MTKRDQGITPKPALSIADQVLRLKENGLVIENETFASKALLNGNYFRLSGYFREFQSDPSHGDNRFPELTTFEDITAIVRSDVRFSRTLLDALFRFEKILRSRFAYYAAMKLGETGFYLEPAFYFSAMPKRDLFIDRLLSDLDNSKSRTLRKYRGDSWTQLPIWVAIELLSFGQVARMIEYTAVNEIREDLAHSFSFRLDTFASTVHSLATLRNACAHHKQLWNRFVAIQTPAMKREKKNWVAHDPQSVLPAIIALTSLLEGVDKQCERSAAVKQAIKTSDERYLNGITHPAPK